MAAGPPFPFFSSTVLHPSLTAHPFPVHRTPSQQYHFILIFHSISPYSPLQQTTMSESKGTITFYTSSTSTTPNKGYRSKISPRSAEHFLSLPDAPPETTVSPSTTFTEYVKEKLRDHPDVSAAAERFLAGQGMSEELQSVSVRHPDGRAIGFTSDTGDEK